MRTISYIPFLVCVLFVSGIQGGKSKNGQYGMRRSRKYKYMMLEKMRANKTLNCNQISKLSKLKLRNPIMTGDSDRREKALAALGAMDNFPLYNKDNTPNFYLVILLAWGVDSKAAALEEVLAIHNRLANNPRLLALA